MKQQPSSELIENLPDGLLLQDPNTGEIIAANEAYLEMHGYDREDLVGETVEVLSADDPAYALDVATDRIQQARDEGDVQFEWRNKRANGETFPVEVHLRLITLDGKKYVLASVRDISERKEYQQRYRTAKRHLDAILEATKFGLFLKNTDHEYLLMNERVKEMFGLEELEPGTTDFALVPEEAAQRFQADDRTVLETEEPLRVEEEVPEMGGVRMYLTIKVPVYDEDDELYGIAGFTQDITAKKERERKLEETKRTLERTNEKLKQFAGVVSHDLRNPLNVAQLHLELLAEEQSNEHVDALEGSLDRMEEMIADLLTLARAGETVENPDPVSLGDVATEGWENTQTDDATFELQVPETATVVADCDRLRRVFENLFRNSVEHNTHPLTVRVGTLGDDEPTESDTATVGFFFEDDGDGIPNDEHENVFDHGYTTENNGTGFGLSIVQEIVHAHDWEITVTEGTAGGARFEITGVEFAEK